MKRGEFLSAVAVAGVGAVASGAAPTATAAPRPEALRRRPYGRELSIIGFGGIVVTGIEQSEANDIVAWAVERGVNYFDVAPTYGNAQERLGPALKPYRDQSFLACKTGKRDAAGARAELEESLKLLQTDHLDLYQLHGLTAVEEVDAVLAPGGAMETFVQARDTGLVRSLGFSAHSIEAACKAMDSFDFDSVLFPFNCVCMANGSFGQQVINKAFERNVACLGLKALAWQPWPEGAERKYPKCWYQPIEDRDLARLALSYALDLPLVATLPPGDGRLLKLAVEIASKYEPLTEADKAELARSVKGVPPIFSA